MRVIAEFVGLNSEFRVWLAAQRGGNIISMANYRHKKSHPARGGRRNPFSPSIA